MAKVWIETKSVENIKGMLELEKEVISIGGKDITYRAFGDCFGCTRIGEYVGDETTTIERLILLMAEERIAFKSLEDCFKECGFYLDFSLSYEEVINKRKKLENISNDLDFFIGVYKDNKKLDIEIGVGDSIEDMVNLKNTIKEMGGTNIEYKCFGDNYENCRVGDIKGNDTSTIKKLFLLMYEELNDGFDFKDVIEDTGYMVAFELTRQEFETNKEKLKSLGCDLEWILDCNGCNSEVK